LQANLFLYKLLATFGSYMMGFAFYALQLPEKHFPGRFDLVGHSHQIWHLFVFTGVLLFYYAVLLASLLVPCHYRWAFSNFSCRLRARRLAPCRLVFILAGVEGPGVQARLASFSVGGCLVCLISLLIFRLVTFMLGGCLQ